MGAHYSAEAIDQCLRLYLKFNGQQHARIEREMRKVWPGWSKANLYTRGKAASERDWRGKKKGTLKIGWIEKYGWEKALQLHLAQKPTAALNNAQKLVREVEEVRDKLFIKIKAEGVTQVGKEVLYLHRDYSKLSIEALTKVEAARDTLGGFVSFYERFVDWMTDIDPRIARSLLDKEDLIVDRAEKEFGETEGAMTWRREGDEADSIDAASESRKED